MSFEFYIKKYRYYRKWYEEMSYDERTSEIGKWVYKNCTMYSSLITNIEAAVPVRT